MLVRLHQIRTVAGTIECHFALLAAALWANTPVDSGAKAFLLADFTDRTTQSPTPRSSTTLRRLPRWYAYQAYVSTRRRRKPCRNGLSRICKLENPCKIRCFPQARGYKIGPAGIKPKFFRGGSTWLQV